MEAPAVTRVSRLGRRSLPGAKIAPYEPSAQNVTGRLQGPSGSHLLGTDELGRDLLSRLLFGTRIALGVAFPAVLAALVAGLVVGMIAGYLGGRVDNLIMRVMDIMLAFPGFLLAIGLVTLLGTGDPRVERWDAMTG